MMSLTIKIREVLFLGIIIASFNTAGCENTFEPLLPNDQYNFTIFGALDMSADTQWVRVMPVLDSLYSKSTDPIDAKVTLIQTSTGETTVLRDSLFEYRDGIYAWNYWTTTPILAEEEYTLIAEASDGRASSATVTIPPDFPTPTTIYNVRREQGEVTGTGVERLVVADAIYYYQLILPTPGPVSITKEATIHISHIDNIRYLANNTFKFYPFDKMEMAKQLEVSQGSIIINKRELLVISGSEDWPDLSGLSRDEMILHDLNSNVENGLGVLSGIVSKRLPMESCYDEVGEIIPCPLIE